MESTSTDAPLERLSSDDGTPAPDDGNALGSYERRVLDVLSRFANITPVEIATACRARDTQIKHACETLWEKGLIQRFRKANAFENMPYRYALPGWARDMRPIPVFRTLK
jgi:hypothetical protein